MTKFVLIPQSKKQIEQTLPYVDAYLIGVDGLSVNIAYTVPKEDLKDTILFLKNKKKEIFIALNKNMHNKDLPYLEEILDFLEKENIQGIFFYDIALVSLKQKKNLKTPLVWSQEHLTTNATTGDFWYQEGVQAMYVSSEITLEEINTIQKNTKMQLFVPIFGYLPMFTSKRHLVKNYLERFSIQDVSSYYYMEKEGKKYPIIDNKEGTVVYSAMILNGIDAYFTLQNNKVDYVTFNGFLIDDDKLKQVLTKFRQVNEKNKKQVEKEIDELFSNVDRGFLYKETIYRVKKNG